MMKRLTPTLILLVALSLLGAVPTFLTLSQGDITPTPRPAITIRGPVVGPGYTPPTLTPFVTNSPVAGTPVPTIEGAQTATSEPPVGNLPNLDPNRMGIQLDSNLEQADWDAAMYRVGTHLGVKWIKLQIPWEDMQPNGANDVSPFFQRVQLYIEDADRRQFNILLSIAKAPTWARSVVQEDGPPDDPQAFASFLTLMLREFGDSIDAVEIWNEPNLIREWRGVLPFDGAGYMRLFDAAYQAVRAYSPTMSIVTAGLAPTADGEGSVDDRSFLRQMYANGLGNYADVAIGVHPYGWGNPPDSTCCGTQGWDDNPHFFFGDNLRDYRQIISDSGHAGVQMWVTEFGWASWDGYPSAIPLGENWMGFTDRWEQGQYTIRAFEIGQQSSDIGLMFLWNLNFATLLGMVSNSDERAAYSIVVPGTACQVDTQSTDTTERPLYWMLYDAVRPEENLATYGC